MAAKLDAKHEIHDEHYSENRQGSDQISNRELSRVKDSDDDDDLVLDAETSKISVPKLVGMARQKANWRLPTR